VKRHSTMGRTPAKTRRRMAKKPTRSDRAKVALERGSSAPSQAEQIARLTSELNEALEQQAGTAEVLRLISASPGDLESVFATLLKNAAQICDANLGNIWGWDGKSFSLLATHNLPPNYAAEVRKQHFTPSLEGGPISRAVATKMPVHVIDFTKERGYAEQNRAIVAAVELGGDLAVPWLGGNELIGTHAVGLLRARRERIPTFLSLTFCCAENRLLAV
jgi:hypothetical protein